MKSYNLKVEGAVWMDLNVEIVDPSWSLSRILEALRNEKTIGFNPLCELPMKGGDWRGYIRSGENVIARYGIYDAAYDGEIEGGYDEDDNEIDSQGELVEDTEESNAS